MDCKRAKGLILSDYADGVMRGHELEELESHLGGCSQCRLFAADVVSAGKLFRSAPREEPPAIVWDRIRAQVSASLIRPDVRTMRPAFTVAVAAAILAFVLVTAQIVSDRASYISAIAGQEIVSMVSLQGQNGSGEYDMGTSVEIFLL